MKVRVEVVYRDRAVPALLTDENVGGQYGLPVVLMSDIAYGARELHGYTHLAIPAGTGEHDAGWAEVWGTKAGFKVTRAGVTVPPPPSRELEELIGASRRRG